MFCGHGRNKTYADCRTDHFDNCEVETWSPLWIRDFLLELGIDVNRMQVNWLLPGMVFADGLRIIDSDADTLMMTAVVPKFQFFKLYVTEKDIFDGLELDDICIGGTPELSIATSPKPGSSEHVTLSPNRQPKDTEILTESEDDDNNYGDDFVDSDNEVDKDDDDLYEEWVDEDVTGKKKETDWVDDDYDSDDLDLPASDSEYEPDELEEETQEQDGEGTKTKKKKKKKVKLRSFRPEEMQQVIFKIGMIFPTVVELRKAIQEYIIQNRVQIKYAKNDLQRVRAYCDGEEECPWYLFAAPDSRTKAFVVKTYEGTHKCSRNWELKQFTAKYLAAKYVASFRANDKMTLKNFARLVQEDFNMTPSRSKLARARRLAIEEIHGDEIKQYQQLWDYAAEIRYRNPGSSIFMKLTDGFFSTLYMSLDACKRGFMAGCRPLICIDGAHIKTKFGGQLLTAVGVDPNDCIFPIAMAVVEVEDTQTWKWFLNTLKEDLGIENTGAWTIMSDRQKGLIKAVNALFPQAEHRFCVRHLFQNFNKKFKGENLKNRLWAIARSYNMLNWRNNMDMMKELNQEAYEYLEAIDPRSWCRAFFKELPKSDLLLNNTCEVFNKYILDAREMPIRSMLDKINNQLMTRYYNKNLESDEWCGIICPKIRKKLDKQVEMSNNCLAMPVLKGVFQVKGLTGDYLVDINKDECECGSWQLRGIPCRHACSVLRHERIKPETRVCPSYSISAFKQAYANGILPCRDERAWQKIDGIPVKPPLYDKIVGRPSKKRRKNPIEMQDGAKMNRHGTIKHCSLCNSAEHNKRKCPHKGIQGEALGENAPAHAPASTPAPAKPKRKLPVRRNIVASTQESGTPDEGIQNKENQITVQQTLILGASQASQQSEVLPGPIPESSFLARSKSMLPKTSAMTANVQLPKRNKKPAAKPK